MKTEVSAWLTKLAIGVATATTIGGGGALISATSVNAVQDQRISQLEADRQAITRLSDKLDETNKNVAVLNERLKDVSNDK